MMPPAPEPLEVIAKRVLEAVALHIHRVLRGRAELGELRSLGAPAVPEALARWNGKGRFEGFVAQRVRWTMLRNLRRQARRDERASFRHDACALAAADEAANRLPDPRGAREAEPAPATTAQPSSIEEMMRLAATGFTVELAACDVDPIADPAQDVEHDALRMHTRRAVERLPEPLAALVEGYYYRGETLKEVGADLGMSSSTVFDRLGRAVEHLRDELCGPMEGGAVLPFRRP